MVWFKISLEILYCFTQILIFDKAKTVEIFIAVVAVFKKQEKYKKSLINKVTLLCTECLKIKKILGNPKKKKLLMNFIMYLLVLNYNKL